METPPPSSGGVFLSYAREDTEAARRIADALRAFGVDVWFDQSELRGGEAWDGKIRKQIRECTLFVAIISANTQARGEGYFRREWKLAVERTHDMAAGMAFLIPVVVDDTAEDAALVPDELMKVHWTRLPRGVPTSPFVERMKMLAENPHALAKESSAGRRRLSSRPAASAQAEKKSPAWLWPAVVAVVALAAIAALVVGRKPASESPSPKSEAVQAAPAPAAVPVVSDKSLAVLPFANMSADKDNEFFTDGIHEDILTNLAHIRELRVVSRTSVMKYKNTEESIRQIASELGVAYILEGSVRRSGNRVRVTGQLIRAASDEHVWAQAYDRDVTDIFAIQGELAEAIAGALETALSPEEKTQIARKPTENAAAYDLFLRAREVRDRQNNSDEVLAKEINLLKDAIAQDPSFAQAWGELADTYAYLAFKQDTGIDGNIAKAKEAIDKAVALAPDDPQVIIANGTYYYYAYRNYAKADELYQSLVSQTPNDASLYNSLALIERRQGNWLQSLGNSRKAIALDPANITYLRNLEATLNAGNRYAEMREVQKRIVAFLPDSIFDGYVLANISFYTTGSTEETDAYFAHLSPEELNSPAGIDCRRDWMQSTGRFAEAARLDRLQPYYVNSELSRDEQALFAARVLFRLGDKNGALERMGSIPADLQARLAKEPKNARNWIDLATAQIIAGDPKAAMQSADKAVEILPESLDALDGPIFASFRALIYDWAGNKDVALAEYRRLLRLPSGILNVYFLKAVTRSLRGDPRFEALIADPANNAAIF